MYWALLWFALPAAASAPLVKAGNHLLVDGVMVNGQGPFCFLFDTGSESTALTPTVAAQLGLRPTYRVELVSVNGTVLAPATGGAMFTIGNRDIGGAEVLWTEMPNLPPGIAGILGQSALSGLTYSLDLRAGRLELTATGAPGAGRLPLEWLDGRPAVRIQGLRLVLDSGTATLVLFRGPGAGLRPRGKGRIGDASGRSRTVDTGVLRDWSVAGHLLHNVPVAFLPGTPRREDGLLPLALFRTVVVNPAEGYVALAP